jgi:hypothetical protein
VLASDAKGRDIRIDSYSLSFHGRVLVENADVTLKCVCFGCLCSCPDSRLISAPFSVIAATASGTVSSERTAAERSALLWPLPRTKASY